MLKKTASILILGIFIFNWFGYRVVNSLLQYRATALLEVRLDQNKYYEAQLISVKIPVNLPYYTNSPDYDRVDGEILIDGKHYNFVKRRLFNDSLEYLCIPNDQKMSLRNARDEFYKKINGLHQPSQNEKGGSNPIIVKHLLAEYCQQDVAASHLSYSNIVTTEHAAHLTATLSYPSYTTLGEPPEA